MLRAPAVARRTPPRARAALWLACVLWWPSCAPAADASDTAGHAGAAQTAAAAETRPAERRVRELESLGRARPLDAAGALEAELAAWPAREPARADALLVRGLLLARAGQLAAAARVVETLESGARAAPVGAGAALLLRAEIDAIGGAYPSADRKAGAALSKLGRDAPAATRLRFLHVAASIKDGAGQLPQAAGLLQEALRLADDMGDAGWRATLRTALAYTLFQGGETDAARRLNEEAIAIASDAHDELALARAWNTQSILLERIGSTDDEAHAMRLAIEHAQRAGAAKEEALFMANLADLHLKQGDHALALAVARQALPLVRARRDLSGEVVALANAGLALISMRRFDEGKREIERAIAIDERRGSLLGVSQTLEETGRYLERAGDSAGALAAFLRHRTLQDELLQRDTQQALLQLQEELDDERRSRELELLERQNRLRTEQLEGRTLTQRIWLLAAATGALAVLLASLLLQRMRKANRRLVDSNARLKAVGERDPLTGLANRRALHETFARLTARDGLEGTLFMIDIDGFKRINDERGHAVGDAVLIEVAQRLRDALRQPDLIVRWGGEEFLVLMPTQGPEQADALARRLLQSIGDTPVPVDGRPVTVTVSAGFVTLPLEPQSLSIGPQAALDLVDAAMLLAKRHGRNRAYGVRLLQATHESDVTAALADFETACRDGRVHLHLLRGPSVDDPATDAGAPRGGGGPAGPAWSAS